MHNKICNFEHTAMHPQKHIHTRGNAFGEEGNREDEEFYARMRQKKRAEAQRNVQKFVHHRLYTGIRN